MENTTKKFITLLLGLCFFLAVFSVPALTDQKIINIGLFSRMDFSGWGEKSFSGKTIYQLDQQHEKKFLRATADKSASALYRKIKVDLNKTPFLNWSWRVDKHLSVLNEQEKSGDDYVARIYVIVRRGLAPWRTNALNYVWSSNHEPVHSWKNAFTDKAIMIPLRTRLDANKEWKLEKANVKLDFKKHFGIDISQIDGVAIMTDTDNSKSQAVASYGDIYFSDS